MNKISLGKLGKMAKETAETEGVDDRNGD